MKRITGFGSLVFGVLLMAGSVHAMNHNLLMPWTNPPRCSPPQTPLFSFCNVENDDFMFRQGGKTIEIRCQAAVRTANGLSWTLHHNMVDKPFLKGDATAFPGNLFKIKIPTEGLKPGFYDVRVKLEGLGYERLMLFCDTETGKPREVSPVGVCTFGWRPDEMPIVAEKDWKPSDFESFWREAMLEYRAVPLDLRVEGPEETFSRQEIDRYNLEYACLPPNFDPDGVKHEEVVSYKISFAGPDGGRVFAWVARPKDDGVYPALLVYPGAGTGGRPRPLDQARHGYVAMDVQVHGFDVDTKASVELPWYNMDESKYPAKMPSAKELVWYNLHRRALRAIDAVLALPGVDVSRLAVCGGSQGGRLAVVAAALDARVKAAVPCIVNSPNMPHLYWTKKCNASARWWGNARVEPIVSKPVDGMADYGTLRPPPLYELRTMAYFDPLNFAPQAKCPVYFNGGLIDPVSPSYSTYAVYLRWGGKEKTFTAVPGHGHDWWAAFDRDAYRWLAIVLKLL